MKKVTKFLNFGWFNMKDEEIDCFGTYEDGHVECLICDESEECKKVAKFSNKIKIALLCTSLNFFIFLIFSSNFFYLLIPDFLIYIGDFSYYISVISFFLIQFLSPVGSFLFNLEMKKISRYWFLGLPFSIAILINYIIQIVPEITSKSPHLFGILQFLFWVTIAPLSVLFFFSIPENQRKNVIIPVIYSMIASVFCVFYLDTLSFYIMPIIGIGILIFAFTLKNMHPPKEFEQ